LLQSVEEGLDLAKKLQELTTPVTDLDEGLLVSATYDGDKRKAVLKFYDSKTGRVWLWEDNTGHRPYCYTKLSRAELDAKGVGIGKNGVVTVDEEQKLDLLTDSKIMVRRIVATDPLAIGGASGSLREKFECWEADIKYYENYAYDRGLKTGTYYKVVQGNLTPVEKEVPETVRRSLDSMLAKTSGESASHIKGWAELLGQPLVSFKRIACDIEVANEEARIPDPEKADREVIAVSFHNEAESLVYLVQKEGDNSLGDGAKRSYRPFVFPDEASMLRATFGKMMEYPFLITFNGDDFDLRYLKHRAEKLGVNEDEIPIALQRQEASLKHGVHIDLYRFFNNRSIQVYVYSNKYAEHTLNGISEALLDKSKIEFEGNIGDLPLLELANYCLNDSVITYELTSANDSMLMKILLVISRIAKMPMNDVARLGVSNWIRSMLFYEHRQIGALIPRSEELKQKGGASSEAIIKGKKYKGGLVIEPTPGIHFGVSVLDFASLYPSIIKVYNLSYETVNCGHEECRSNKVPDTDHWVCKKRSGIESLCLGSLRDLRVSHYKQLSKDKTLAKADRDLNSVVSQGLKVILNAGYGVMGFETFALYCLPVAEATAALGRYAITKTIEKCKQEGISVIYSDTDSLFIENPDMQKVSTVVRWADDELGVELDIDKVYRYVAFSERKKNYFGVLQDGTADIKGLTGKKSQTPEFLKKTFYQALDILGRVYKPEDFPQARSEIKGLLTQMVRRLREKQIPMEELAFNVMIGKSLSGFQGTTPQHVKAAKLLEDTGKEIKAGDIISFVKTRTPPNVKPVSLARIDEIDADKYLEYASSMFDQMLDSLGFSFDEITGSTTLDAFWS
jgi:DNA polymerase I